MDDDDDDSVFDRSCLQINLKNKERKRFQWFCGYRLVIDELKVDEHSFN